jgi:AcrR family transcriptional regulator
MAEITNAPVADQGQAARALWRANGYAGTTVADICRVAHGVASEMLAKPYDVPAVITAVLATIEETMRRSTPELVIEAILEGYRQALAGHDHLERTSLPEHFDVDHVANVAQSLVGEGARHQAAGRYGKRSFADVVGRDITALVPGFCSL